MKVLNRPQPYNPLAVESEGDVIDEIDTGVILKDEIIKAMKKSLKMAYKEELTE